MKKKDYTLYTPVSRESSLLRPMTPSEIRRADLLKRAPPPPWDPAGQEAIRRARKATESDLAFKLRVERLHRRLFLLKIARETGGSGLLMANTLRHYFSEYLERQLVHSVHSFPSSFNVVEAFLTFDEEVCFFDLRPEREHILSADDYFDWYSSIGPLNDPAALKVAMEEGVIYSYNMTASPHGYTISITNSEIVLAGLAVVRHDNELSCMLVAGEFPPHPSDEEIEAQLHGEIRHSRGVAIHHGDDWSVSSRYLAQIPTHAQVILLTRFNLESRRYDVRYINLDIGVGYSVITDDLDVIESSFGRGESARISEDTASNLDRYGPVLSALASLIFLPLFFVERGRDIKMLTFRTLAFHNRMTRDIKSAVRELGEQHLFSRTIVALPVGTNSTRQDTKIIEPPDMSYQTDGYWKTLSPGEIGEDDSGNLVVGRTWVSRTDAWTARDLQSFLIARNAPPSGPDPGYVYVIRSEAHGADVYKVGLTRRDPRERAQDLTYSTATPLPLAVLASWLVGDCGYVEREAHRQLAAFRVNPRREFFRTQLDRIIRVINRVVESHNAAIMTEPT